MDDFKNLEEEDKVSFDIEKGNKGLVARKVIKV